MKVRFIIKEQDEVQNPSEVETDTDVRNELNTIITNDLDGLQLAALRAYAKQLQNPSQLEEKKENCFKEGKYKTFKGKTKCIQRTKGISEKNAAAYVASVLRDMGELPKKKKK
mgnify:CR=1 FL=1|tara:strand:+ start:540 stop:878 length:339 start_codon:yes stop_codon:yes gene_type:complete